MIRIEYVFSTVSIVFYPGGLIKISLSTDIAALLGTAAIFTSDELVKVLKQVTINWVIIFNTIVFRSSRPDVFYKKGALKNFAKFPGKTPVPESLF